MSATFLDGPAAGSELNLRRLPLYLRVVVSQKGVVDALDQPEDEPRKNEKVYAYRMVDGSARSGFMCGSIYTHIQGCHHFNHAQYRMLVMQPEESILRNGKLWRKWVEEYHRKETV